MTRGIANLLMQTRLFLCLLTLLALPPLASAQFEGWYQIEVLVFERTGGFDDELWPSDITLRYPLHWQELRDPNEVEPLTGTAVDDNPLSPQHSEPAPPDLAREPFYKLPETQRKLNREHRQLAAQGNIRVLFHEAWRQHLASTEETPAILVSGGEAFDKHHRLEGSLQFSVARYLHLNSNLWLSDFQINTGQGSPWPEIPLSPLERLQRTNLAETDPFNTSGNSLGTTWASSHQPDWQQSLDSGSLTDFLEAPYLPRRIVTLQQHRRMRSDELHYIDHPRLGLLVIIHPYEVPPAEAAETTDLPLR